MGEIKGPKLGGLVRQVQRFDIAPLIVMTDCHIAMPEMFFAVFLAIKISPSLQPYEKGPGNRPGQSITMPVRLLGDARKVGDVEEF